MKRLGYFKDLLIRYIKEERVLFYLSILSLIIIFCVQFLLSHITEFWIYGHETGIFFTTICYSYVASYVFYFFVVFRKEKNDFEHLTPISASRTGLVIKLGLQLHDSLFQIGNTTNVHFPPTLGNIKNICQKTDFAITNSPGETTNWFDIINHKSNEANDKIEFILKMPKLDVELVKYLTDVQNCSLFFKSRTRILGHPSLWVDKDLSDFELWDDFYDFFCKIARLKAYWHQKFDDTEKGKELNKNLEFHKYVY